MSKQESETWSDWENVFLVLGLQSLYRFLPPILVNQLDADRCRDWSLRFFELFRHDLACVVKLYSYPIDEITYASIGWKTDLDRDLWDILSPGVESFFESRRQFYEALDSKIESYANDFLANLGEPVGPHVEGILRTAARDSDDRSRLGKAMYDDEIFAEVLADLKNIGASIEFERLSPDEFDDYWEAGGIGDDGLVGLSIGCFFVDPEDAANACIRHFLWATIVEGTREVALERREWFDAKWLMT